MAADRKEARMESWNVYFICVGFAGIDGRYGEKGWVISFDT